MYGAYQYFHGIESGAGLANDKIPVLMAKLDSLERKVDALDEKLNRLLVANAVPREGAVSATANRDGRALQRGVRVLSLPQHDPEAWNNADGPVLADH